MRHPSSLPSALRHTWVAFGLAGLSCTLDTAGEGLLVELPTCGDGVRNGDELCDGSDFGVEDCASEGFVTGSLRCTTACLIDTSGCTGDSSCGDGHRASSEACDGSDFGGATCLTLGFASGSVQCSADCELDLSACVSGGCGDGVKQDSEACDGIAFGEATCASAAGLPDGALACTDGCELDTSDCHACGNGKLEGSEHCDGDELGGETCISLGHTTGLLACGPTCEFDASDCYSYPPGWLDPAWHYRRKLTVDPASVAADLDEFPMLVAVTDPSLAAHAQPDGRDITFTASDGKTRVPHEVEYFDAAGVLVAWVRVTLLSSVAPTELYLYYGNATADAAGSPAAVWTSGYVAVWHLAEPAVNGQTSAVHADSTGRQHDGAQSGNRAAPGRIAGAQRFSGADFIEAAAPDAIVLGDADCTVSAWIRTASSADMGVLLKTLGSTHETGDKLLGVNHTAGKLGIDHGWVTYLGGTATVTDDAWHHVAWTQRKDASGSNETWTLYVDGKADGQKNAVTKADVAGHTVRIGAYADSSYFSHGFDGMIDEVRISSVARTAVWLATSWENQRAPETFCTVGPEDDGS